MKVKFKSVMRILLLCCPVWQCNDIPAAVFVAVCSCWLAPRAVCLPSAWQTSSVLHSAAAPECEQQAMMAESVGWNWTITSNIITDHNQNSFRFQQRFVHNDTSHSQVISSQLRPSFPRDANFKLICKIYSLVQISKFGGILKNLIKSLVTNIRP